MKSGQHFIIANKNFAFPSHRPIHARRLSLPLLLLLAILRIIIILPRTSSIGSRIVVPLLSLSGLVAICTSLMASSGGVVIGICVCSRGRGVSSISVIVSSL